MAVACVCETADIALLEEANCESDCNQALRDDIVVTSEAVTALIRKKLCPALRDLIQHGLMPVRYIYIYIYIIIFNFY